MHRKGFISWLPLLLAASLLLGACASPATLAPAPTAVPTTEAASLPTTQPTVQPTIEPTAQPTVQPTTLTLTDGLSRTVTLPGPAQRVVSLAPSNTEILFAIGAGPQTIGRDDFSDYPADAAKLPSIGGNMGKYNNEAILSLKPDLVLASQLNTAEQVKGMEDLGLKVYLLPNPNDLDGMYQNLMTVAKLTGHEAETDKLVQSLKDRVTAVTQKTLPLSTLPTVFYELDSTNPNAPYTSGPGTFIDRLIKMAGGINVGSKLKDAYAEISLEQLVVENPNIILLGDFTWGGVKPEDVAKRSGWEKLKAVVDNKVYTFDDNLVSRPGPRLVDGLEALAKLLHPEQFK
ncbi:MAG TPA: helical backbone metal receptor [Anaerolineales bacterium]